MYSPSFLQESEAKETTEQKTKESTFLGIVVRFLPASFAPPRSELYFPNPLPAFPPQGRQIDHPPDFGHLQEGQDYRCRSTVPEVQLDRLFWSASADDRTSCSLSNRVVLLGAHNA